LLAVAALAVLARKLQIAYPSLFGLGGLLLGFMPGLPALRLNPELVFVLFLPPLLYPAKGRRILERHWLRLMTMPTLTSAISNPR